MVVPDRVVQGQRLIALAPRVAGPGIAIDDDCGHAELAQPRAESDPALAATNDDHVRLRDVAELFGFAPALLEPGLPIRDSTVLGSPGSPAILRLLVALEIVQRRQQRPSFAVSEPEVTDAAADRGLELDPALVVRPGGAQLVSDCETAGLHLIERLSKHIAYALGTLDRDDVPGERDQVAPVAVFNEEGSCGIDVPGGQSPLKVRQPPYRGSCGRGVDRSISPGFGHGGTPSGAIWRFGGQPECAKYLTCRILCSGPAFEVSLGCGYRRAKTPDG